MPSKVIFTSDTANLNGGILCDLKAPEAASKLGFALH